VRDQNTPLGSRGGNWVGIKGADVTKEQNSRAGGLQKGESPPSWV